MPSTVTVIGSTGRAGRHIAAEPLAADPRVRVRSQGGRMSTDTSQPARAAGTITVGGELDVARLGYGSMRLTGPMSFGPPRDRAEALRVLRRAVELGITFIDTAAAYGPGIAEELIAEALVPYPDGLLIATKGGLRNGGGGRFAPDGRPEALRADCEASLRRLRRDRIDLYQLHRVDPRVPLDVQLGALAELREEGKIRLIGLSQVDASTVRRAHELVGLASVQNLFNLVERSAEPVLELCEALELAFIPWFPLATGQLAEPGGPLARTAARLEATPSQVALAWLLHRSPVMLPIPGTSSVAHLEQNVAGAGLSLSDADLRAL